MTTESTSRVSPRSGPSTRTFAVIAVLVCLALAGLASYYASGHPDGLNKVAADQGLAAKEKSSVAADSPLAGYSTQDVSNDRLSGGIAGVVGVTVVLLGASGLAYVVRRRAASSEN